MKDTLNIIFGPQGLILIGGILTLIGALWSAKSDLRTEKELNRKNEIIIEKTEKISELNSKIVNVLTGGDSFPYVTLAWQGGKYGIPALSLNGENAIPNVSGVFYDTRELRKDQRKGNFPSKVGIRFSKNILSPAYHLFIRDENTFYDISKGGRYMIHFYTPYNAFSQYLAIEPNPENNHPLQAYKIYQGSGSNKELIHTSYPENFPIPLEEIDFLEELTPHELEESKKRKMK